VLQARLHCVRNRDDEKLDAGNMPSELRDAENHEAEQRIDDPKDD